MKTSWFTFGWGHQHVYNDIVLDKDIVVKITANEPRDIMFHLFGPKWSMQYDHEPDMSFYPRGVIEIP